MNYLRKISILGLISFVGIAAPALAAKGVGSTGGGGALVCRNELGAITHAELLDLYEARVKFGLSLQDSTNSAEGDYVQAVRNTYYLQGAGDRYPIGAKIRKVYSSFINKVEFVQRLPKLNDFGELPVVSEEGCGIEQLAIFYDADSESNNGMDGVSECDRIQVSLEIWNALPSMHKAALATHELYYRYERALKEETSEGTRALVAHIYAKDVKPIVFPSIENTEMYSTGIKNGEDETVFDLKKHSMFWLSKRDAGGVELQFSALMGRPFVAENSVYIPGIRFQLTSVFNQKGRKAGCVVSEKGANLSKKIPLLGSQRNDLALEITYKFGQKVKLGLYQKGVLLEESFVDSCSIPNTAR